MALKHRIPLVSLAALGIAMPAFAQTPDSQTAAEGQQARDVVVVTANKREESVQDIAVAVTAVTAEMREQLGVNSVTDLTNLTPGLSYTAANERITLRGIGRNTNNFGAEPGVANYTDGIYQSFAQIAGRDNIFIDRVEVLRGPQGTLYGRNSVGGALNIISKRPTDDFSGEFNLGFGSFDYSKVGLALSGPLTDNIRGRIVGYQEVRDEGVYFNHGINEDEGYNINNWNTEFQLEGDLGERLSWWLKYTTGRYANAGPPGGRTAAASSAPYDRNSFGNLLLTSSIYPNQNWAFGDGTGYLNVGEADPANPGPALIGYTQCGSTTENPGVTNIRAHNSCGVLFSRTDGYDDVAFEVLYEADGFDVKYLGGYVFYDYNLTGDQDGSPVKSITYNSLSSGTPASFGTPGSFARTIFPEQTLLYNETRAFFSNEVNFISSHDGPIQWMAGLYQYQENFKQPVKTFFANEPLADMPQLLDADYIPSAAYSPFTLAAPNPERLASYTNNRGTNDSYGIFGQVDWEFAETLKATLGLRYSHDKKDMEEEARLFCYVQCPVLADMGLTSYDIYLPYADVTQGVWNGNADGVTTPQPGVTSATASNPSGVVYDPQTGLATRTLEDKWSAVTGTAGLEWSPSSDTLVFAKYSRGYKQGGFNATDMAPLPRTNEEIVNSFELGWKQEFWPQNLTANIAAFLYNYEDMQAPMSVQPPAPGLAYTAFVNIEEAQVYGVEIESVWSPVDNLNLRFTYAYLQSELKDSRSFTNTLTRQAESLTGNELPLAAQNKVAINANYTFDFEDGSSLMPSVSWYWRDEVTTSLFNHPLSYAPDYDQTDARLIWNDSKGVVSVIGWVRNAFDEEGYDAATAFIRNSMNPAEDGQVYNFYTLTLPRTYGVELKVKF